MNKNGKDLYEFGPFRMDPAQPSCCAADSSEALAAECRGLPPGTAVFTAEAARSCWTDSC